MGLFDIFKKKESDENESPQERYINHLNRAFQQKPTFIEQDSLIEGVAGVTTLVYKDYPKKGFVTGVTYGLSLVDNPSWMSGRTELCISVESKHEDWMNVVGYIANALRGDCPFAYGQTIDFEQQISEDSDMNAFFVYAPNVMDQDEYSNIEIGTDYNVNIAGLYPIYAEELKTYEKIGHNKFWNHPAFVPSDVKREQIVNFD